MEKILVVEDNKTLAKLIAKKIEQTLKFQVDIAYNLQEAKLFLKAYKYFVVLLEASLPEAPNGLIVDYALSRSQHVIVHSGNIDKEFREKILQKGIIDYVNKTDIRNINYILHEIVRLQKNKQNKILVVNDSMIERKKMKTILENLFFQVITVAHGEEALGMLQVHSDFSLVVTDYHMPVMDGLELTHSIRKTYTKDSLSIIALSSDKNPQVNTMFLKSGANDHISKPFSKEEFSCRVNNAVETLEKLNSVTSHINRDFKTGLYNRKYFCSYMSAYVNDIAESSEKYAVGMIDIDNYKNITSTYGDEAGDKVIVRLSEILTSTTKYNDVVAKFSGEEFCVVLKDVYDNSTYSIFENIREEVAKSYLIVNAKEIRFTISIGAVTNSEEAFEDNIAQADMMLHKAKQQGQNSTVIQV